MDELEETLNRVLSDPAEMEKLSRLAGQLFGGGEGENAPPPPAGGSGLGEMLRGLAGSMPGREDEKAALVRALSPFLREDRQRKLQKALRLAKMARIAGTVLREHGGEVLGL